MCKSDLVHSFKHLDLMVTFELNAPLFHRYVIVWLMGEGGDRE